MRDGSLSPRKRKCDDAENESLFKLVKLSNISLASANHLSIQCVGRNLQRRTNITKASAAAAAAASKSKSEIYRKGTKGHLF